MSHTAEAHPHPTTTVSTSSGSKNVLKSKTVMKGSIVKINQLPTQSSLGQVWSNTSSIIFDLRGNSVAFAKKIRLCDRPPLTLLPHRFCKTLSARAQTTPPKLADGK